MNTHGANGCYTFTVIDNYGDGMNGANPEYACGLNGDYTITDSNGNSLASLIASDANFGESESNDFCVNSELALHGIVKTVIVQTQEMGQDNTIVKQHVSMRVLQLAKVGIVQMGIAIT